MTATSLGYRWKLRQVMAEHGLWKTSELGPLLAASGVTLSAAQVYRLVAHAPERLSLHTLAALCDIFSVSPNDLIEIGGDVEKPKQTKALPAKARPKRARVTPS